MGLISKYFSNSIGLNNYEKGRNSFEIAINRSQINQQTYLSLLLRSFSKAFLKKEGYCFGFQFNQSIQKFEYIINCQDRFYYILKKYTMTAIARNPFLRQNPYFVPQRFYSHEKTNSYDSRIDSSYCLNYNKPNNDHLHGFELKRQNYPRDNNIYVNNLDNKQMKANPLRRKNINTIQNPFYRKNLLPANKEIREQRTFHTNLQQKHNRLFTSIKVKDDYEQKDYDVVKLPSKNILQEKENKQKYLSSQLKIKLKSQTEINNKICSTQLISCSPQKSGFVTLGRVQASLQYLSSIREGIPETIAVKGKTYYLQIVK